MRDGGRESIEVDEALGDRDTTGDDEIEGKSLAVAEELLESTGDTDGSAVKDALEEADLDF